MTPGGRTGSVRSVTRGGAHLQYIYIYIYIIDSKRFHIDQLKTLGQVHYIKPLTMLRTSDGRTDAGRTDGRTDGHHLELRTFNYTKSRFDTHRYHFR